VKPLGVLLAGVPGQGLEEAAALLARAALAAGLGAAFSRDRSPSRYAGSVLCRVRLARGEVRSPFIPAGEADVLLALDALEALRQVHQVGPDGFAAFDPRIRPTPRMRMGLEPPPEDALARIRARVPRAAQVGALDLARELGHPECAGGVLLGLASPLLPLSAETWEAALGELGAPASRAAWRLALAQGRALFRRLPAEVRRPRADAAA
jgi:indolepyruvate ferredoxin oxidoreductase beta subunit